METILQQATLTAYEGCRDGSGLCHGQGRAVFSSGQVYDGQWQQGHMHGEGSIQFPDGISYSGTFASDSISGSGVYTWQGATYEGEVLNGFRHGYGRLSIADSAVVYEGQWQHGKRHGRGVLFYSADQTAYYEGDWVDDMKEGQGTSVYPSGNTYSGSWVQDQRQGQGSMHWATKAQHYTGQWMHGLPDGFGEHVWEQQRPTAGLQGSNHAMHVMHNRYVGMFKEGQRHGEGVLYYSSGARYEGQWQHGKKHGQGVYVFEDGNVFSGHFMDDRPVLATGAVLGADSTFAGAASSAGSTGMAGAAGLTDMQQVGSGTTDALGHIQPEASSTRGAAQGAVSAGAAKRPSTKPAVMAEAASAGQKPASATAALGDKSVKAAAAGASKPGSATSKPAASKTAVPTSASPSGASAASASGPSKRASTAASATSASASSAATGSRGGTPASQSICVGPSASTSSCTGPSFGPATSVMQLYIADLLQEYEGQPAPVYRAVSNLLVGFTTELRLMYDKYSACPSPLLDATTSCHSWAMQACQLWELLRDAHLLCRHVSLQQVCDMVQLATAPPPAVLQHRQQVEASAAEALQLAHAADGCYNPGTQLLFRDFCEVLVRVAAARYPLLPSLEMQLQQVMSYHMLPLLGGSSRQLAGAASRASIIAAAAAASAVSGGEGAGGCEQQLRGAEVVQYLQSHVQLLQELFVAFAEAGQGAPGASCAVGSSKVSATSQPQLQKEAVEHVDETTGQHGGDALQQDGQLWQHKAVLVRQIAACLQSAGVLEQHKLSLEAVAACLLHNALAVTDPQGVRACIDEAASETSYMMPDAANSSAAGTVGASPEATLKQELLFWMDAPLLLQEGLWGLVRVAALLPAPSAPSPQQRPSSAAGKHTQLYPQQQGVSPQPVRRSRSSGGGGNQPAIQAAPAAAGADQALLRYQQLFIEDCREDWDAATLPRLQLLLEGTFRSVLGWQPAQVPAEAKRDERAAPASRGSAGLGSEQLFGGDEQEGEQEEGPERLEGADDLEVEGEEEEEETAAALEEPGVEEGAGLQEG